MAPPRLIARHLAHPRGVFGRFVGGLMNRYNRRINRFALELLDVQSSDRVAEIGFGGGVTLAPLIARAAHLTGIDRSCDVVAWATERFQTAIDAGRADFRVGEIEALPLEGNQFDKVCSINTVYFWRSLGEGASEIRRVLKADGVLVLGFLPGDAMARLGFPTDIFTFRSVDDVGHALRQAGFGTVEIRRPEPRTAWNVIFAR
ncbi:class I SAM-dependent methyltransferase [Bradyrhizobium sp. LTSPM299]|jgi:arsenite methyltransferase|uniref:class I SAM-dependent methyltransferase n=1 Tax=Bradyrhizobium sp. LTSPM299 TaxID=1619233 RepID=UPI000678C6EC|nr:class I SAM-dependent methyltransferase [Bradyrhizobium sp. LTSPM299]